MEPDEWVPVEVQVDDFADGRVVVDEVVVLVVGLRFLVGEHFDDHAHKISNLPLNLFKNIYECL